MASWMPVCKRSGASSWIAGALSVPLLALTGCGGEAYGDAEDLDSIAQALCTGVKLSSEPVGTLPLNSSALLTATNATCAAGEIPEYRFMYKRDGDPAPYAEFRGWSSEPTAMFDNTGLPSGKYTLQVRARNLGSTVTQNSQATVTLNSGEVCSSVALSAAPNSPVLPGKAVTLSSRASCTEGTAEHQYSVRDPAGTWTPLSTWTTDSHVTWDTSGLVVGKYGLRVYARRTGNLSTYESQHALSFTLSDTCHGVGVSFSPGSPQPSGTMVTVDARATCPGGSIPEFRYHYQVKGTNAWFLLQDWSSEESAGWDTAGLGEGSYQVRVQTRAPGATNSQAFKTSDFKVTAPACASAICGASDGCCPEGCESLDDDCP